MKVGAAWVPWTHRRLAAASGYAAGVGSPGWYRHVFEHPGSDGVARFFVEIAGLLRAAGLGASPDDLIAGTRLATTLAALRGRPRSGLAEVLDAAEAVMGNADLVRRSLVVGDAIGVVPPSAPQVPLARDVARLQKSARLAPAAAPVTLEVDLRTTNGMRRSVLLHRMLALGVPWGVPEEGRGTSGTFRETWRLAWEPELSIRLIERAGYGTTLEAAATAHLVERAERSAGVIELIGVLDRALLAQLAAAVEPALRGLARRAATDPDIGHLMDAVGPLGQRDALRRRAWHRDASRCGCCSTSSSSGSWPASSPRWHRSTTSERRSPSNGCRVCRRRWGSSTIRRGCGGSPTCWRRSPRVAATVSSAGGRPDCCTTAESGRQPTSSGACRRRSAPGTPAATGAAFVEGFLAGSGTVLVHDRELLGVLDTWLGSLDRRGVRQRGGVAAADVRCVRAGGAAPDHDPAGGGPVDPLRHVRRRRRSCARRRRAGDRPPSARPAGARRSGHRSRSGDPVEPAERSSRTVERRS